MKPQSATVSSKGQLVVPTALRKKHGIEAGTRVHFLEDQFGRIVLQPITEEYIDQLQGSLADLPDLLADWEVEHRREGARDE
jgi:AbrB family looped-hinge helix DNA binding protein